MDSPSSRTVPPHFWSRSRWREGLHLSRLRSTGVRASAWILRVARSCLGFPSEQLRAPPLWGEARPPVPGALGLVHGPGSSSGRASADVRGLRLGLLVLLPHLSSRLAGNLNPIPRPRDPALRPPGAARRSRPPRPSGLQPRRGGAGPRRRVVTGGTSSSTMSLGADFAGGGQGDEGAIRLSPSGRARNMWEQCLQMTCWPMSSGRPRKGRRQFGQGRRRARDAKEPPHLVHETT